MRLPRPLPLPMGARVPAWLLALPLLWSSALLSPPFPVLAASNAPQASLPDAATLLRDVEANQKHLDEVRENYTFRAVQTIRHLDANGNLKSTDTEEREVSFIKGHQVRKLVRKNGKDLTPEEAKKEQDRVNREVQKYERQGQENADKGEITVARLLEIVSFSHPRRVIMNGRNTIAFDFVGDPHAKTHGRSEEALKKVYGAVWIDEADREVSRMSATLDENYHVGFGFLASIAKGSNLVFDQALIRNEVWLPTAIALRLQAKAFLVVGMRADVDVRFDQYLKFEADAEQQPGATVISK